MSDHVRHDSVLDRGNVPAPREVGQGAAVTERSPASPGGPLARGWGSHEERRLIRWAALGFLLLALYAVVFVVTGVVMWSETAAHATR